GLLESSLREPRAHREPEDREPAIGSAHRGRRCRLSIHQSMSSLADKTRGLQSRLLSHCAERVDPPVAVEEIDTRLAEIVSRLLDERAELARREPAPRAPSDQGGHARCMG